MHPAGQFGARSSQDAATSSGSTGNHTATPGGAWHWPGRPANPTSGPAPTRSAAPGIALPEAADDSKRAAEDAQPASALTSERGTPAQDGTADIREGVTASGTVSSRGIGLEEVVPKQSAPADDRTPAAHTGSAAPADEEPLASSPAATELLKGNPQPAQAFCDRFESSQRRQNQGATRQIATRDPYVTETVAADVAVAAAAAFAAQHPYLPCAALQATYAWLYAAMADQVGLRRPRGDVCSLQRQCTSITTLPGPPTCFTV